VGVQLEQVEGAEVVRDGAGARLAPTPATNPARQPLRVPPGWLISYNEFYEVDPAPDWVGRYDQLQGWFERRDRAVDLEWRRDDDHPGGGFLLRVYSGDGSGQAVQETLLHSVWSDHRPEAVRQLERVFALVQVGRM
jgi:hypothetical protein